MKMMLMASILLSVLFMGGGGSHPVSLVMIILAQTMVVCLTIWVMTKMSWFSYILFLIFLGGLMVLFIYISSLASNEMFNAPIKENTVSLIVMGACLMTVIVHFASQTQTPKFLTANKSFSSIYSEPMLMVSTTTMLYLLLTLIVVVKMTSKYEGPLRSLVFKK